MDFLVFTEGRNELANNGLPSLCWFLLSTKSVDSHVENETLAAANLGEITGTGYERQSESEPLSEAGMVNFSKLTWKTGSATDWSNAVRTVILATDTVAICAWNLEGGAGRDLSAAFATLNVTPVLDLSGVPIPTVVPVGAIMMWPTSAAPDGWRLCNGSTVPAADNPALAIVLGQSNGNVTLPNLVNRFPLGASPAHPLGSRAGVESVALTPAQTAIRNHTHSGTTGGENSSLAHQHSGGTSGMNRSNPHWHPPHASAAGEDFLHNNSGAAFGTVLDINQGSAGPNVRLRRIGGTGETDINHEHGFTTNYGGPGAHSHNFGTSNPSQGEVNGGSHDNMPPYLTVNFIIRVG